MTEVERVALVRHLRLMEDVLFAPESINIAAWAHKQRQELEEGDFALPKGYIEGLMGAPTPSGRRASAELMG